MPARGDAVHQRIGARSGVARRALRPPQSAAPDPATVRRGGRLCWPLKMSDRHEQRSLFGEILDWMLTPLLLLVPVSIGADLAGRAGHRQRALRPRARGQHRRPLARELVDVAHGGPPAFAACRSRRARSWRRRRRPRLLPGARRPRRLAGRRARRARSAERRAGRPGVGHAARQRDAAASGARGLAVAARRHARGAAGAAAGGRDTREAVACWRPRSSRACCCRSSRSCRWRCC